MDPKLLITFALLSLVALVSGIDESENLIEDLKTSRLGAEKILTEEQVEDINKIRSGIPTDIQDSLRYSFEGPQEFTHFHKSIGELIETKGTLCHSEIFASEEGIELFKKEFNIYVLEPCKQITEAYSSSLDEFYKLVEETPSLPEQIEASDKQEYDWLLNAGICRHIIEDVDMMRNMSFGHVLCIRMIRGG